MLRDSESLPRQAQANPGTLKSKHTYNVLPARVITGKRRTFGNQAAARRATARFATRSERPRQGSKRQPRLKRAEYLFALPLRIHQASSEQRRRAAFLIGWARVVHTVASPVGLRKR